MINIGNKEIIIKQGDITEEASDAIINPANQHLQHGGGAAAAICQKAGPILQKQSNEIIKKIGLLPTGKAVITDSGNLLCKYVIHTVGPRMGEGNEAKKLKKAIWSSLTLSELYNLASVSLPAVSSGIFGFPKDQCAKILLQTSIEFLNQQDLTLTTIVMCNRDRETYQLFVEEAKKYL